MKRSVLLLFICLLICLGVLFAGAQTTTVYDTAGLFSAQEIDDIAVACREAKDATNADFYIITSRTRYEGEEYLDNCDISSSGGAVILILSLDNDICHYDMYTFGRAERDITDREVDGILDDPSIVSNINNKDFAKAGIAFVRLSADALGKPGAFGNLDSFWNSIKVGFFISLAVALVVCLIIVGRYKNKLGQTNYPLDKYTDLNLRTQSDVFIGKTVTTRHIESSSGSGSGSHGSSHSGGSGHRGGR